jgi:hypothetical protein
MVGLEKPDQEVVSVVMFRTTNLVALWRVDYLCKDGERRQEVVRLIRGLYKEITIYEGLG